MAQRVTSVFGGHKTSTPEFDTQALLQRAAEIDPQAWALPLFGKYATRRLKAMQRAKAELVAQDGDVAARGTPRR